MIVATQIGLIFTFITALCLKKWPNLSRSELVIISQIYIRRSCAPLTPLLKTFYIRNEYLSTSNCVSAF